MQSWETPVVIIFMHSIFPFRAVQSGFNFSFTVFILLSFHHSIISHVVLYCLFHKGTSCVAFRS